LWNAFEEVSYYFWDYGSGGILVAFCVQNFVSRNCAVDSADAGGVLCLLLNLAFIFS
jgi:hypothetical protein